MGIIPILGGKKMSPFVARPFVCANPQKEESLGYVLTWFTNNVRGEMVRPLLQKYGLEDFDPNAWYPTQTLLNVVRELYDHPSVGDAVIAIGKKSAEDYPFGPEVRSLEDAIMAFNEAHHTVHRGAHPEQGFLVEKQGDSQLIVTNNNPWPKELIFGILWTFGARFGTSTGKKYLVSPLPPDQYGRARFQVSW
jgi:hypothetical protein